MITKYFHEGGYEQTVKIRGALIYHIHCTCKDFLFRKIKCVGENADKKYFAEPCKHLKPYIHYFELLDYNLKIPDAANGTDKLTTDLKIKLIERAKGLCEGCGDVGVFQVHRIIRGENGGKYNLSNCQLLCGACHRERHANEFPTVKSK